MIRYITLFSLLIFLFAGCSNDGSRKIKIADENSGKSDIAQTTSSVLQVSSEEQKTIAVLYFKNETGQNSLDWLQRGLTDMLTTDLKQSPYLNILTTGRLIELARQYGKNEQLLNDPDAFADIAGVAKVHILLTGRYFRENNRLFIDVEMRDIQNSRNMFIKSIEGESLEKIFSMVDELSSRVRENLRSNSQSATGYGLNLTQMTNSLEAFRYYSKALENHDKLYMGEAEKCLEEAIDYDSTFAAAYLRLALYKQNRVPVNELKPLLEKAQKYQDKLSDYDKIRLEFLRAQLNYDQQAAFQILKKAVETYPNVADFHWELASYYHFISGELEKAFTQYEIVKELDPNLKLLYNQLGYLHAEWGDFQTAFTYFDKYKEMAPDEPNPYDSKAEILIRAGNFEQAEKELKYAVQHWPNFHYSISRLAALYIEMGDFQKALTYCNKLAEEPDTDKKIQENRLKAFLYWRFGKLKEARRAFASVLSQHPYNTSNVMTAVRFYDSIGDSTAGRSLERKTFSLFENSIDKWKDNANLLNDFLVFGMESHLPAADVIPVMEKLGEEVRPEFKTMVYAFTGLLNLKFNRNEAASELFTPHRENLLGIIENINVHSWEQWRYIFRIMKTVPDPEAEDCMHQELLKAAEQKKQVNLEYLTRLGMACTYSAHNEKGKASAVFQQVGVPSESDWMVIGPFSVGEFPGFHHEYPPEEKIDVNVSYQEMNQSVKWVQGNDGSSDGYVDLNSILGYHPWTVGYGLIYAYSPVERKVQIRLGTEDGCKLWLNNTEIWRHFQQESAVFDGDLVTVLLQPGYNKLLIKVTHNHENWGYFFRITDENGKGYPDITFHNYHEVENSFAEK